MTRWMTQESIDAHQRKHGRQGKVVAAAPVVVIAKGEPQARTMNRTEARYEQLLALRRHAREIVWYEFESWTFKLAERTRYTPDFPIMLADGSIEVHEVKGGFVREDAWLKLKMAASIFPFKFYKCQWAKGEWTMTHVKGWVQ